MWLVLITTISYTFAIWIKMLLKEGGTRTGKYHRKRWQTYRTSDEYFWPALHTNKGVALYNLSVCNVGKIQLWEGSWESSERVKKNNGHRKEKKDLTWRGDNRFMVNPTLKGIAFSRKHCQYNIRDKRQQDRSNIMHCHMMISQNRINIPFSSSYYTL